MWDHLLVMLRKGRCQGAKSRQTLYNCSSLSGKNSPASWMNWGFKFPKWKSPLMRKFIFSGIAALISGAKKDKVGRTTIPALNSTQQHPHYSSIGGNTRKTIWYISLSPPDHIYANTKLSPPHTATVEMSPVLYLLWEGGNFRFKSCLQPDL